MKVKPNSSINQASETISRIQDPDWYTNYLKKAAEQSRYDRAQGTPLPKDDPAEHMRDIAQSLADELTRLARAVRKGDMSSVEKMLLAQAYNLEAQFNHYSQMAASQVNSAQFERFMRVAVMCQEQSRKTLKALVDLKNPPRRVIYVKNELTQVNVDVDAQLVGSAESKTQRLNQCPSALEENYGGSHTRREKKIQHELIEGR